MKQLLLCLAALLIFNVGMAQDSESDISVYYLIRHAEKDRTDKTNKNPVLTQQGLSRALKWAEVFKDVNFDEVYSTDYSRTKQTAEPTAFKQKKTLKLYNPSTLDIEAFKAQTRGKTILIVGHSNTTPVVTNKLLGEKKYKNMDDADNAGLYIVTIVKDKAVAQRLSIN